MQAFKNLAIELKTDVQALWLKMGGGLMSEGGCIHGTLQYNKYYRKYLLAVDIPIGIQRVI